MPQTIAARYKLVEVLGRGGMGAVWRARDRTLGREVAIKEVSLPRGLDEAQVQRIYARTFREARSAARLDHPGIGFKQESFDRNVPFNGHKAAEVQFSFTQNGIPARCRVRVFKFDGALYQALMAADREHWDQGVPYFETFLNTLQSTS